MTSTVDARRRRPSVDLVERDERQAEQSQRSSRSAGRSRRARAVAGRRDLRRDGPDVAGASAEPQDRDRVSPRRSRPRPRPRSRGTASRVGRRRLALASVAGRQPATASARTMSAAAPITPHGSASTRSRPRRRDPVATLAGPARPRAEPVRTRPARRQAIRRARRARIRNADGQRPPRRLEVRPPGRRCRRPGSGRRRSVRIAGADAQPDGASHGQSSRWCSPWSPVSTRLDERPQGDDPPNTIAGITIARHERGSGS